MFIHLGNDVMVPAGEIVAILDYALLEKRNLAFLENHKKTYLVIDIGKQETKSAVVTTDENIYLSPFSTLTLKRRLNSETPG
ncbi:MAG TPA: DUF370 domain-containing protein [Bacillales bacterium]|nr:DUF370 domain-containing protein [Bacillales bacterium]